MSRADRRPLLAGRGHFVVVYVLPLVFIIVVSEANFFFDVRDLEPRVTIASSLLLCMVAFQYTIEQEIPKVSYPLWINYYLVGCYSMIVMQVGLMVGTVLIAGRRVHNNQFTKKQVGRRRSPPPPPTLIARFWQSLVARALAPLPTPWSQLCLMRVVPGKRARMRHFQSLAPHAPHRALPHSSQKSPTTFP